MFLRAVTIMPAKFNTAYFDDASLSYSFPVTADTQVEGEWPLPVTATLSLQVPVSLTQVTVTVDTGESIELMDTIAISKGWLSTWRFTPTAPGLHVVTLTANELTAPVVQNVNVPVIRSTAQQDRLFPTETLTLTDPIEITFTLYSPITLTEPSAVLTDPLGMPLTITLLQTDTLTSTLDYQWLFTPTLTGTHALEISATEFTQPLTRSILVASARVYLPIISK
jgi:hypothetical protein